MDVGEVRQGAAIIAARWTIDLDPLAVFSAKSRRTLKVAGRRPAVTRAPLHSAAGTAQTKPYQARTTNQTV